MTFNIRFIFSDFLSNHKVGFEILMLLLQRESTVNFQLISKHIIAMLFLPHMTCADKISFCYFVCFLLMMEQNHTHTFNSQTEQDKLHCKDYRQYPEEISFPNCSFHTTQERIYTLSFFTELQISSNLKSVNILQAR